MECRSAAPVGAGESIRPGEIALRAVGSDPTLEYFVYVPSSVEATVRVLVAVHGLSERAASHADTLAPLAERYGVVLLAPHFAQPAFRDYQRLGRTNRGPRADRALDRMLAEVGQLLGAPVGRVSLFGYSAGAQFVHRYVMAHPGRVVAAAAASAGWYTFPYAGRRYPHGIGADRRLPGVEFDPDAFLRVPILVTVGDEDVGRDGSLRKSPRIDRQQGHCRVERAERWMEAMRKAARAHGLPPSVALRRLPGCDHSFESNVERGGLGELVFEELFGSETAAIRVTPRRAPQ